MQLKNDRVIIKGSREGLVVLCCDKSPWNDIIVELERRIQSEFFEGADVIVDIGKRTLGSEQVGALWDLLQKNGLRIKALKTGSERVQEVNNNSNITSKEGSDHKLGPISYLPTLIVNRHIRSGQDIIFAGNVTVFGDMNPGAVIQAKGSIMVWGDLRGHVHAGAEGDENAWVAAIRLQPTQLRIANYISCAPEEEPLEPEMARVYDGIIIVRELKKNLKL